MEIKQKYNKENDTHETFVKLIDFDKIEDVKPLIRLFVHDIGANDDATTMLEIENKNGFKLQVYASCESLENDLMYGFTVYTFFRDKKHLTFQYDRRTTSFDKISELIYDQFILTIEHCKVLKSEKVGNEML